MKNRIIITKVITGISTLLLLSASAFAATVIRGASGPDVDQIIPAVGQFLNDIGGSGHTGGGSFTSGYRVMEWNDIPQNIGLNPLPADFYNTTVPIGAVLSSTCSDDTFNVSSNGTDGVPLHFGNFNANYTADFKDFTGPRLFSVSPGGCNYVDIYFYIPGTKIPATVSSFGAVFTDVDFNQSSGITYYGIDGKPLMPRQKVNAWDNGLSFVGVSFNGGERVAHVRVYSGTGTLGQPDKSRGGMYDVVVMGAMIFGEPRAIGQHSSDFDGDGTSDFSVFRPSNGFWYTLQSGSNTVTSTQFGMAGDIPLDGDFDGDSRNDQVIFRPSTSTWYTLRSSNGQYQGRQFGLAGDKPMAGDYDKDGVSDISVWRPSDGNYYYLKSSNGQFAGTHFGQNGDIPIGATAP